MERTSRRLIPGARFLQQWFWQLQPGLHSARCADRRRRRVDVTLLMCLRASQWIRINASPLVVNWILEGVPLFLSTAPPRCELPNRVFTSQQETFIDQQVCELLLSDSIRRVPRDKAHCVLPLGVCPKKSGKLRLVLDSRHTNSFISCLSFKNEGLDAISSQIQEGDLLVSVDLEKGFHHLRLRPDQRKFLCFKWRGHYFQWCVLPFGVKSVPYLFSRTVKEVLIYFRTCDVRCTVWVDDFLFMLRRAAFTQSKQFILQVRRGSQC